jgi:hypothetical protein
MVGLVLLIRRKPVHPMLAEDPVHGRAGNRHLMKAPEVGPDPARPKMVPLPQIQDLADHLG